MFSYFGKRGPRKLRDARRAIIERQGYGENWPSQRQRALERDNYTCQKCGRIGKQVRGRWTVHVHHKRKIRLFVNSRTKEVDYQAANDLDNLITLCPRCHRVADGHQNRSGFLSLKW